MTKLKTKKGKPIAKRTLSVILAAAMVLSSNSLVWANVETEPQAEVEAVSEALAEEVAEGEIEVAAQTDYTSTVEVTENGWGKAVTVKGDVKDVATGQAANVNYVWKIDGEATSDPVAGTKVTPYVPKKADFGKSLELEMWVDNADGTESWSESIEVGQISAASVTATFTAPTDIAKFNKGKNVELKPSVTVTPATGTDIEGETFTISDFELDYTGAPNTYDVGSKVTVTGALTDPAYVLTNVPSVSYVIAESATASTSDLEVSLINPEKFYLGKAQAPAATDFVITDKNTGYQVDGTAAAITSVTTTPASAENVGEYSVQVTLNPSKVLNVNKKSNYADASLNVKVADKFNITALNLEECSADTKPIKLNATATEATILSAVKAAITVYAPDGKTVINDNLLTFTLPADMDLSTAGSTYTITVSAASGKNIIGSMEVPVTITAKNLNSAGFAAAGEKYATADEYYTGAEIEKDVKKLGNVYEDADKTTSTILVEGKDYTLEYNNNVNAGRATVTIVGMGDYTGLKKSYTFTIKPANLVKATGTAELTYNENASTAADYAEAMALVVDAKGGSTNFIANEEDYTVAYKYVQKNGSTAGKNEPGNYVLATVTPKANLKGGATSVTFKAAIREFVIEDADIIMNKTTYTYTGAPVELDYSVVVDGVTLKEGVDYTVVKTNEGVNVGKSTLTIKAVNGDSVAKAEYEIVPASLEDLTITVPAATYTGKQIKPVSATIKLGKNTISAAGFTFGGYGENINAGEKAGTVTLTVKDTNKNFVAGSKEVTFDIKAASIQNGKLKLLNKRGVDVTNNQKEKTFTFDGTAKEFYDEKFTATGVDGKALVEGTDFEIRYLDNTLPGTAKVVVVGLGNYVGTKSVKLADGSTYEEKVAEFAEFTINSLEFEAEDVTIAKTAPFLGGDIVKPEVTIVVNGVTLVEGEDFEVVTTATKVGANQTVTVKGLGGYAGSDPVSGKFAVVKQDMKNVTVKYDGETVKVINGNQPVPESEYDVVKNDDGTVTVVAKKDSKNYEGSSKPIAAQVPDTQVLDVVAKPYTKTKIHVTWRNIANAENYVIYKDGVKIAEAEDGKEGYIDGGMHSYDGIYEYQVAAVINGKEGTKSDVYESTTRPADPVVNNAFTHKNGIRVETKAKGAEGYRVWIRQGGSNPTEYVEKKSTYGNYTFKDLKNGQKYVIKVQAYKLVNGKKVPSRNVVYVTGKAETAKKSLI